MNHPSVADEPLHHYSYWRVFFLIVAGLTLVLSIGLPVSGYKLVNKFSQILFQQVMHDNDAIADFFIQYLENTRENFDSEQEWLRHIRRFVNEYEVPNQGYVCLIDQQSKLQAYPGITEEQSISFDLIPYNAEKHRFLTDMPVTIPDLFNTESTGEISGEILKEDGADIVEFKRVVIDEKPWLVGIHQGKMDVEQPIRDLLPFIVGLGIILFLAIVIPFGIFTGFLIRQHELVHSQQIHQIEKHTKEIEYFAEQLQETNNRLSEMQAEKSRLYARLSHDLRAPLSSVLSACNLVAEGAYGEATEKQKTAMQRVERNVKVLLELIDNILQLSRIESGTIELNPTAFSLPELINELRENMSPAAESKHLTIKTEIDESISDVITDRNKLYLILQNMVNNAIKFTHAGAITLRATQQEETVEISVNDTGSGIRKEDQLTIFQEFARGENGPTDPGVGLGLAITKDLTELLGGTIELQSDEGVGSTFTVSLPKSNQAIPTAVV